MNNSINYSTEKAQRQIAELKKRYIEYVESVKNSDIKRSEFQIYVAFLHKSEHYPKIKIAELVQLTRERIGQILSKFVDTSIITIVKRLNHYIEGGDKR